MDSSTIQRALLSTPSRAGSVLPELIEHFGGDDAGLMKLLEACAGMEFVMPEPAMLRELQRDESILRAVQRDCSELQRAILCREHGIDYRYLGQIYLCVFARELPAPVTNGTSRGRVQAALALLDAITLHDRRRTTKPPPAVRTEKVVTQMFGLTSAEVRELRKARKEKQK